MGVLYAKVDGSWVPILNSTGTYLPLTGGTLTGPLLITGSGELDLTSTAHHLQLGASTGGNLAFDANEIQARNNGAANVLNLNPHGGNVWLGSDTVASNLHLRGPFPTGTPLDFWSGGQRIASMFPFGSASPVDMVFQTVGTSSGSIAIQCLNGEVLLEARGHGTVQIGKSTSERLRVISGVAGATWNYISFYDETNTTRRCFVGAYNDAHLALHSDGPTGHVYIGSGSGYILFGQGLASSFTEWARFDANGLFLIGKTVGGIGTEGYQAPQGTGADFQTTNSVSNTPCFIANKVGAGVASGHDFFHFRNNNSTIGSITRNGTTAAVLYNTSSDYRLKNDHGPITGARERIRLLTPRRIVWKDDETEQEQDGFFAHEVTDAVPEAVTGAKDAVAAEDDEERGRMKGAIIPQQLDATRLIPLLTAALQEAHDRIDILEARLDALEAA